MNQKKSTKREQLKLNNTFRRENNYTTEKGDFLNKSPFSIANYIINNIIILRQYIILYLNI